MINFKFNQYDIDGLTSILDRYTDDDIFRELCKYDQNLIKLDFDKLFIKSFLLKRVNMTELIIE